MFRIPGGSPLQVRLQVFENNFIRRTVQTEEFPNLFVTLKTSKTLDKQENQS